MDVAPEFPEEVAQLRTCLNDLVSIMGLPTLWTGGEPQQIVGTLLEALLGLLRLAFVFVRLNDPEGGPPIEMVRVAESWRSTGEARGIGQALDASLGDAPLNWPSRARAMVAGVELGIASARLGLHGQIGVVAAGSHNVDFPAQTEQLLLHVAANQAVLQLQQARLLGEQKRVSELDQRVAQQTKELGATNEQLKQEIAERKRAEEALGESERESRLIVDSVPGLVALLDADGSVEIVNRQILKYTGRTLEELRQWGISDVVHPDDLPHVREVFGGSIASGSSYEIVQRLRRSDGVYRWFQNSGFPLRDGTGRVARWYVLLTDIDDRKRAEDVVRQNQRDFKVIIDTIPALVWTARPDGSAEFFNQHYLDFVGLSTEETRNWGWTVAVHPDDLNGLAAVCQRILTSARPGEAEARLRGHDGQYRWFLFRTNPLRDEKGNIVQWYGVNTDIEDRKRAEADLLRAYYHLTEAQRLSQTGSFTSDLERDEYHWSEEFYRLCEFEPGSRVTIQRLRDIVHAEDVTLYESAIEKALGGSNPEFEFRIVTPRGAIKHMRGFAHRIAERPVFVGAIQDVTETKLAEEALDKARSELAHVARVTTLSALTASIAHEVNQPLSGIITNASTCLRMLDFDPPNIEGARETARRTIRDGNRASDVIQRLRALYSKKESTLESLDLNEATREVLALSLSDLQRNRVIVQSELAEGLPPVTGDRVQLQQVILNLLSNASDSMAGVHDRPRQLLVRTERDGDGVRMSVRDSGVGVDGRSIEKLFGPFYTTKNGGMGIGLSVSRSIVERHQGRLWAEPNEGPGATFSFSVRCNIEHIEQPDQAAPTSTS